jgi:hypothetical protein
MVRPDPKALGKTRQQFIIVIDDQEPKWFSGFTGVLTIG